MNLYYNTTAQCRVDENNVRIAAKPVLHYAACPEWVLHFYSGDPSETPVPVDLSDIVSWRAAVDSDWNSSTEPMCRTLAADIDASGKAQGVIRVPVNANTARYLAVVQGKQSVGGWFELRGFDDGGNVALVCLLTITCNNSIDPTGGAEPEPVDNDTATMTWVRAIVAQQLYYQYSADGSTWHNPPMVSGTDVYFRVKHGADGTPSAAQLIPYGPQGEPGTFDDTSYLTFDSVSASNLVTLTSDCVPVAVKTDAGSYYPIEKQSVTLGTGSFTLDVTPYLAYDDAATFSGTWTVYLAAGLPGEQPQNMVPPGTVHAFAGTATSIPTGYLLCNGAAISRADYAVLFAAIGTIYGTGDGSTTFNLPDFRGKFLRGYLDGTSAALGTAQGDAIRNLEGSTSVILSGSAGAFSDFGTGVVRASSTSQTIPAMSTQETGLYPISLSIDASRTVPTAAENRPANYAVNYIIKY